jgi:DNA-binding NtrC family response regulator
MNLFIVDSDKAAADKLEKSLYNRFGKDLNISTFFRGESCIEKVDATTNFVVLAYFFDDQNGNDILKSIKAINPKTEVIMLSSNTDVVAILETLRGGATDYLVKGDSAWRKLVPYVYRAIAEPIRRFGKEYGPPAYIAMFATAFVMVGICSFFLMKMLSH